MSILPKLLPALLALFASSSGLANECAITSTGGAIPAARLVVLDDDATATSTFCGGTASYTSDAWLADDGDDIYLGTGNVTPSGYTVELGAFTAGRELVFYIYVYDTDIIYYSGPGERNPDGLVHAAVNDLGAGAFLVGFEDLFGGGDQDYDDINLVMQTTGIAIDDEDIDDDGVLDEVDNCVFQPNPDQGDADEDANGDVCDVCPLDAQNDADGDGFCADVDNCPATANDQTDADGDGAGDVCDGCPFDADDDSDHDGVCGDEDACPDTASPDGVPKIALGVNRWADVDGDGVFDTRQPNGEGPGRSYTIEDTAGCSCGQIIEQLALGAGHAKFGCSISAMDEWVRIVGKP
jgi:hypothetical protein